MTAAVPTRRLQPAPKHRPPRLRPRKRPAPNRRPAISTGGTGGALAGLKGTTPLVELSQEFQDKLLAIDLSLGTTFNYAAETYDAINIIALAVEKAKTDGIDYAKEINGITRDGEKCTDFATCKAIIDANGDPDYDGQSGPLEFAGTGEPLQASFGVLTFGDDNRIDNSATTFIEASRGRRRCPAGARRRHPGR